MFEPGQFEDSAAGSKIQGICKQAGLGEANVFSLEYVEVFMRIL